MPLAACVCDPVAPAMFQLALPPVAPGPSPGAPGAAANAPGAAGHNPAVPEAAASCVCNAGVAWTRVVRDDPSAFEFVWPPVASITEIQNLLSNSKVRKVIHSGSGRTTFRVLTNYIPRSWRITFRGHGELHSALPTESSGVGCFFLFLESTFIQDKTH